MTTVEDNDVLKRTIRGSKWVTIGIFIQKIFGILSFLTVARLLEPAHYGMMAMVAIIANLLDTFLSPSFGQALIQKKEIDRKVLDQVWSLGVYRAIILSVIIFIAAPYIEPFFNVPGLTNLLRFSSTFILIQGFANVGQTFIFRELAFEKILLRDVIGMIIQFSVTLIWAIVSPSAWALAAGTFAMYFSTCIVTFFINSYRPKFVFSFPKIRQLIGYSKWVVGQNIINYFSSIIDTVFIARILDASSIGLYTKSKDLSAIPSSYIYQITYKVGLSAYAKIQGSLDMVRDSFIKTLDFALIISLIFSAATIGYGLEYIQFLLGDKWISIYEILKLLSVGMIFRSIYYVTFPVFDGVGMPKFRFLTLLIQLISSIVLIYIFRYQGLSGISIAIVISMFITAICSIFMIIIFIKIPLIKILQSFTVTLLPFIITCLAIYAQKIYLPIGIYLSLVAACFTPVLYFCLLVLFGKIFHHSPHKFLMSTTINFFKR